LKEEEGDQHMTTQDLTKLTPQKLKDMLINAIEDVFKEDPDSFKTRAIKILQSSDISEQQIETWKGYLKEKNPL
jgi:hypothetical protein